MTEAIKKLIAENRWQPIEEAPKIKGCFIIGWSKAWETPLPLRWFESGNKGWWTLHAIEFFPTHFRALPDDRLADVCAVLLEVVNKGLNKAMVHDHEWYEDVFKQALSRANEIATKGE